MIDKCIRDRYMATKESKLRDIMLSATECGTWLVVPEMAKLSGYKVRSIQTKLYRLEKSFPNVLLVIRKCKRLGSYKEYQLVRA